MIVRQTKPSWVISLVLKFNRRGSHKATLDFTLHICFPLFAGQFKYILKTYTSKSRDSGAHDREETLVMIPIRTF